MKPRRERDVQRAILDALKLIPGVVAWKSGTGSFRATYKGRERFVRIGKVGVSDIIGWRHERRTDGVHTYGPVIEFARFLAIECKARGKTTTPEQRAFLESVRQAGGIAVVAYDVADVFAALGVSGPEAPRKHAPSARPEIAPANGVSARKGAVPSGEPPTAPKAFTGSPGVARPPVSARTR